MCPSWSVSASPVRRPRTRAAVNTDPAGSAASAGSPSKEYSVAVEAVSTTRPRPWPRKRSRRPRSTSPLAPWANAPLKHESRMRTWRRARQCSSWSSTPGRLDSGRREAVLAGVGGGEVQPAPGVQQPVTGQVDQQQVPGAPAVQEVLDGQPDLLGWLVDHG